MTMQDRAYAVAIFLILGFCCIGAYVAISGFLNANPGGLQVALLNSSTETPTVGVTIVIPTETAAPPTFTPPPPTRTPKGFKPTDTPAVTRPPTLDFIPTVATAEFTATPAETPTPSSCGASYCPRQGPPDARGPKGDTCSTQYIWGFVVDPSGQGLSGVRVHFREAGGAEGDARTKGDPDPRGRFDFPAPTGTWTVTIWAKDQTPISAPFQIQAGQSWGGSGNCPTRVDFIQQ